MEDAGASQDVLATEPVGAMSLAPTQDGGSPRPGLADTLPGVTAGEVDPAPRA